MQMTPVNGLSFGASRRDNIWFKRALSRAHSVLSGKAKDPSNVEGEKQFLKETKYDDLDINNSDIAPRDVFKISGRNKNGKLVGIRREYSPPASGDHSMASDLHKVVRRVIQATEGVTVPIVFPSDHRIILRASKNRKFEVKYNPSQPSEPPTVSVENQKMMQYEPLNMEAFSVADLKKLQKVISNIEKLRALRPTPTKIHVPLGVLAQRMVKALGSDKLVYSRREDALGILSSNASFWNPEVGLWGYDFKVRKDLLSKPPVLVAVEDRKLPETGFKWTLILNPARKAQRRIITLIQNKANGIANLANYHSPRFPKGLFGTSLLAEDFMLHQLQYPVSAKSMRKLRAKLTDESN